jgi:5-methylcytosine-specific restriction endonuclease McrA
MAKRRSGRITVRDLEGNVLEVVRPGSFQRPKSRRAILRAQRYGAYWRIIRQAALERDGRRCACCGSKKRLEVHHLTYERAGHELLEDLVTLCQRCHATQHKWMDRERRARFS